MDGIINVYKEEGFTSHDVVAKLRGILHQKKIGHTGTLDPAAVGVLPVCCGKATKVCELLTDKDKSYRAVCKLGIETDTQDTTGTVLQKFDISGITEEDIIRCVSKFEGDIMQIPPMYSALKVNGKKLYELAREGKTVERKARPVTISEIKVSDIDIENGTFTMDVTCSKGTYIRTLCHDIGVKLGCGACMETLKRTRVSTFALEDALTLGEISELVATEGNIDSHILPVEEIFKNYDCVYTKEEFDKLIYNGNSLKMNMVRMDGSARLTGEDKVRVYDSKGTFMGIFVYNSKEKLLKVEKMFF